MKKESSSKSIAKLIMAVSLIVGLVVVIGLMGFLGKMKDRVMINDEIKEEEIKEEQEITNSQQIILFDEEVYGMLKEFAGKQNMANISDDNILLDAIEFQNGNIKERLEKIEYNVGKKAEVLEDAIHFRGIVNVKTKVCIARSVIYNNLKHTCDLENDSFISIEYVDDILAAEEIIPYFLAGLAYFKDGDYAKASYYLNQIPLHRQAGIDQWEESYFLRVSGKIYEKIYRKTIKVLNEIETVDETANWKTYWNEEYGFEMKYPNIYKISTSHQLNEYQKSQGITYLVYLKHSDVNASISVQFTNINFNLQDIKRRYVPTGNENLPEQVIEGQNTFYFYGTGGGGVSYPDNYFYNLNGKLLIIGFDGPYVNDRTPSDETKQLEPQILSTFEFIEEDETADWKTYRNEEFGFELKYPQNWNEKEALNNGTGIMLINTNKEVIMGGMAPDDYFLSDNRINPKYSNDWIVVQIDIYFKPENFNWDSWIKNNFPVVENYESYKYEGLEGIKVTELKGLFRGEPNIFLEGEKLYNIRLFNEYSYDFNRDSQKDNLALNYFNQIISTFKFIEEEDTENIKLFYYNTNYDPKFDCLTSAVVPVEREIPKTESQIQDAINLLIKGEITAEEKLAGFMSEFPHSNFKLLDTNLENGALTLSFTEISGFTTGGSCRISILSAQIIKTAEQFNEVEKVIFSPVELFQF